VPATDGERFYAVGNRHLEAYDVASGARAWSERPDFRTAPANYVVRDGRVLAAGSIAVALDVRTGRELWRFTPDTTASFSGSAADQHALYFGTMSHRVYAVSVADGALLWSTDVGPAWTHKGIIRGVSVSGDTVYAGVDQHVTPNGERSIGWIFALDRATGRVLWSYQNGTGADERYIGSAPRVAGRLLLAVDYPQNTFIAVDRFTGREVWRVVGDSRYFGAEEAPVVAGDVAYGASEDRHVYAMRIESGQVLWKTRMPGGNRSVAICGSRLLVNFQGLGVLDRATGEILGMALEGQQDFPTTGFAVTGNRAFVSGYAAAYGLECP
jgi:outer membrane protein assembly factor BamB